MRAIFAAALFCAITGQSEAQTNPNLSYGQVLTAGQLNALFASKQDVLKSQPLGVTGGTLTGPLRTAPSSVNSTGFSLAPGTAPSVPADGDFWLTSSGLFARVNGTTVPLAGAAGFAPIASPAFNGVPTAPTAPSGTSSLQIATTGFAMRAVGEETSRAQAAEALLAPLAGPSFSGNVSAPALTLTGSGLTGNVSSASVAAPGFVGGQPLSAWFTTPYFLAASSPNKANAYGDVDSGKAAVSVINTDGSAATGQERYGAFFAYAGPGTGDPAVINSAFGLGAAGLKKNWQTSTVPDQSIGINITARGGYHGSDASAAYPQYGGYNPAGDTSSIIANSFVSSAYSQNAILEGVSYYGEGGAYSAAGNLHGINVQLGAMRMLNPDGSTANPGIGLALAAKAGSLGYAIQVNNTARAGSYETAPGIWGGFLRYNFDDGTRTPFDAFRVDQDGSLYLSDGSSSTPSKRLRANGGSFQVLNNAGSPVFSITDAGAITAGASLSQQVLTDSGPWPTYTPTVTFDSGSTAAASNVSAAYNIVSKALSINTHLNISVPSGGTPGSGVKISLPPGTTLAYACFGTGREVAVSGKMVQFFGAVGSNTMSMVYYDNATVMPDAGATAISLQLTAAGCYIN